jgi:hypothetical protein
MQLANNTIAQHFLSQTEQRLNALNPQALPRNQKIFSFSLTDREIYAITLDNAKGRLIARNLCLDDLFSFDVKGGSSLRMNFESLFARYEGDVRRHTESLIQKLSVEGSDIKTEVIEICAAKIMSLCRNPYSIKKVLNTFGNVRTFHPTDPDLLQLYSVIISGTKPQQEYMCSQIGISTSEYQDWLSVLFMLLVPNGELNLLESIIKDLYEKSSVDTLIQVHRYIGEHSDKRCLLSDRGYTNFQPPGPHLAIEFNLSAQAFIRYLFADIDKLAPPGTPAHLLAAYKNRPKVVKVNVITNDLKELADYNRRAVYQCHSKIYCSNNIVYGL